MTIGCYSAMTAIGVVRYQRQRWLVKCHIAGNLPDHQGFERKDGPVCVAEL